MELYFIYVIPFSFCLILIQVEKKLTYIYKEGLCLFCKVEATIHFPTNNLKQHYTKAEYIGLHRKYSFHGIFWSHVSTFWIPTLTLFFIKKNIRIEIKEEVAYYVPTTLLVLAIFSFSQKIFTIPKSDILATMSWSNNTLLGFKSL